MITPKEKIITEFQRTDGACDYVRVGIVSATLGVRPQDMIDIMSEHKQATEQEEIWQSIVEETML